MTAEHILNRINAAAPAHADRTQDPGDCSKIKALASEMHHLALDICRLSVAERHRLASIITHRLIPGGPNAT